MSSRNEILTDSGETTGLTNANPLSPTAALQQAMQDSAQKRFAEEFGFDVPVESVPLPSNGMVYGDGHLLHGVETVDIRAMTAKDEDILTSRALIKKGIVLSRLIQSCLTNKSIDLNTLLLGDRNAIMIALRITGYGAPYEVEVSCPICDDRFKHVFDLNELPIRRFSIEPLQKFSNQFAFTLPATKKEVIFKFLTVADEEEISKIAERRKKALAGAGEVESLVTNRLIKSILSFGGVEDKGKIAQVVRNLPAKDSLALRQYIDNNEPGIQMQQYATCPQCGEESEIAVPMAASFFWPNLRG